MSAPPSAGRPASDEAVPLLQECRSALDAVHLPLHLPAAGEARATARKAVGQLDDYVLPRYRSLDAPLLCVVGGSTGAGKSTLVNALVGHAVTRTGAIRPTTRQPILLHHPADSDWFLGQRILPGLQRITVDTAPEAQRGVSETPSGTAGLRGTGSDGQVGPGISGGQSMLLRSDAAIPPGVALLDAPDIDSVSDANRHLAAQLLSAADLWIFVTTANRYADAVPWQVLAEAAARDILVAIVLDRVPTGVEDEIADDLRGLLAARGLGEVGLFVVPEVVLDDHGMLPGAAVRPIYDWLARLAADSTGRAAIARRTLSGVVSQLAERTAGVAAAQHAQQAAGAGLETDLTTTYDGALQRISAATTEGTLLRGEVLARWQDFVGTGEFFRSLETGVGKMRDRIRAFFTGKPPPVNTVEEAIESGLHAVIVDEAAKAAEACDSSWRANPIVRPLIGAEDLGSVGPEFSERAAAVIRDWQGELLELIRREGAGKRFTARMVSFGVNGVAVALMVVVFASTAGLTGLEVGIAGGTAIVGQKLLESIFGEDAVRRLAKTARDSLATKVAGLLQQERDRFLARLADVPSTEDVETLTRLSHRLDRLARDTRKDSP